MPLPFLQKITGFPPKMPGVRALHHISSEDESSVAGFIPAHPSWGLEVFAGIEQAQSSPIPQLHWVTPQQDLPSGKQKLSGFS